MSEPQEIDMNGIKITNIDTSQTLTYSMTGSSPGIVLDYELLSTTPKQFKITSLGLGWTDGVDTFDTPLERIAQSQVVLASIEVPPDATTLEVNYKINLDDQAGNVGSIGLNGVDTEITSTGDLILNPTGSGDVLIKTATNTRLGISDTGDWTINGGVGTSGQVLTSGGIGVSPSWSTPAAGGATIDIQQTNTNATYYPTFVDSDGTGKILRADTASTPWSINPNTGVFNFANTLSVGTGSSSNNVYIGRSTGTNGTNIVAIGNNARGANNGGVNGTAVGVNAGYNAMGDRAVCLGAFAGNSFTGTGAVCIGYNAGGSFSVPAGNIIIDADLSTNITASGGTNRFFVNPIRGASQTTTLGYDTTTKEITYYTPVSSSPSYFSNFNCNELGVNKKQRFILPSSKSITASNVVGKIDGTITLPQLYTFGSYVPSLMIAGGTAVVFGSTMKYSSDGSYGTWANITSPFSTSCNAIFWTGTRWIAGGVGTNTLAYSNDGITWTGLGTSIFSTGCYCFCSNNSGRILAGGQSGAGSGNSMAYSDDGGLTWTGLGTSTFYYKCNTIAFDGSTWVAGGQNASVSSLYYGYTGIEQPMYSTTNGFGVSGSAEVKAVAWNGSFWLACGTANAGGALLQSARASFTTWATITTPTTYVNYSLCWNGEMWLMGAYSGVQTGGFYSYDSYNWVAFVNTNLSTPTTGFTSIIWDGRKFIGVSNGGVSISYNGVNWDGTGATFTNGYCCGTNNFKRPNKMLIGTGSTDAVITIEGGTLTTSDLEIVESQWYNQRGYNNFSVRID